MAICVYFCTRLLTAAQVLVISCSDTYKVSEEAEVHILNVQSYNKKVEYGRMK